VHEQLRVGTTLTVAVPRNFRAGRGCGAHGAGGWRHRRDADRLHGARLAERGRSFTLLYCARSRAEAAFVEQLSAYGDAVRFHFDDEAACRRT
jgi:ferredoxin-NADP reductase